MITEVGGGMAIRALGQEKGQADTAAILPKQGKALGPACAVCARLCAGMDPIPYPHGASLS
jgi:hypothetical protein